MPDQQSWLELDLIVDEPSELVLWTWTPTGEGDPFLILVDDAEVASYGTSQQYITADPVAIGVGEHTLRFEYQRDDAGEPGFYDRVYIDQIEVCPNG